MTGYGVGRRSVTALTMKWIGLYQRGLITLTELVDELERIDRAETAELLARARRLGEGGERLGDT